MYQYVFFKLITVCNMYTCIYRSKLKQTEMECEYLKRWFGSLTDQNRKLQKELEELRAVKVGHHHLPPPPSALTMCPRCERVATTAVADTSTTNTGNRFLQPRQQLPSAACYI